MAEHKTVTRQTIIGEKGIALIHQRVSEMGHLWHPRRVDHGIDGHIDLVHPETGALLNSTVLVQSKASNEPFSGETKHDFHYICDRRDLDLWLGGNAPVILVLSHPDAGRAWWVDIKASFPDAKARLTRRVDIDKKRDGLTAEAARALLNLGVPKSTGLYLPPTPRPETLTSNLQKIVAYPERLFVAPAVTGSYREAGSLLREQANPPHDSWLLNSGMILTFADLSGPRWAPLLAGDVEAHDTAEWALSGERELEYQFSALAIRVLQNSYPELRYHKDRRHVHFKATSTLKPLRVGARAKTRTRRATPGRTVFKPKGRRADGSPSYYSHAAAELRLRRLADTWYLEIVPDWCFTTDGWTPSPRADTLTAGIKRLEHHPAVHGWVDTWSRYLRGGDTMFDTPHPVLLGDLLTADVDHGINDELWGPAPTEADEPAPAEVATLFAATPEKRA